MIFDYRKQYQEYRQYISSIVEKARTPATRVSLAVVGTIAFAGFLAVFALKPTLITVAGLWKEINTEKEIIVGLDKKLQLLQTARQNYEQASSQFYLLDRALPVTIEIENMANDLEFLASENSLNALEFKEGNFWLLSPPADSSLANIFEVNISMSVGGQESQIRNFVGNLEKMGRMVKIKSISVRSVPETERIERPFPVYATIGISMFTSQNVSEISPVVNPAKEQL